VTPILTREHDPVTTATTTRTSTITAQDGTQIYYKDWGSGQPIVFSHGWPLNSDSWDAQMVYFASKGFRCIAHDRRGHGRSTQPGVGNDMDTYSDDLATLIDALNLRSMVLIAHSTGGGEVVRYVGRHGASRVEKVVLVSAIPPLLIKTEANPDGLPIEVFDQLRAAHLANRAQLYRDFFSGPFCGYNRPGAKISQGVVDSLWLQAMQAGLINVFECLKALSETDFTEDLRKLENTPTLVIHGDDDQIVPIGASALKSSKLVRGSILKVYPGGPHYLPATHREQLNGDILEFLQS
jgi:non-heme chloroperoxidase